MNQDERPICEHCSMIVESGTGGRLALPMIITGLPERKVFLHYKCLGPCIEAAEKARQPITAKTVFENGHRRELPGGAA